MDKNISIIIPCYNSFHLMDRCLKSLENQTCKNFEVIIIDDCSKDNSYEKLVEWAKTTTINVKLLRNEKNIGAGATRNYGIEAATGEYLMFIDSDDFIAYNTIELLLKQIDNDYDCIVFDAKTVDVKNKVQNYPIFYSFFNEGVVELNKALVCIQGSPWGKLYKTCIIKDNNIKFLRQNINEDIPFTKVSISYCKKIYYLKQPLYFYYLQPESLMHNKSLLDVNNAKNAFYEIKGRLETNFPVEVEAIWIYEYLYSTVMTNAISMANKELREYINNSILMHPNYINNQYFSFLPRRVQIVAKFCCKKRIRCIKVIAHLRELLKK